MSEDKIQPISIVSACATPADYARLATIAGEKKAKMNYLRKFLLAVMAGAYIGLGGLVSISISKGFYNMDVGMQRFAFGAVFPVGLIMVVLTGSELITGNFAVEFFALLNKRITFLELIVSWIIVYIGNLLGSLGVSYFLGFLTNLFQDDPYLTNIQSMAEGKVNQNFNALLCLGLGCNWIVAIGVVLAMGARDMTAKILIIWFAIQSFVTAGFEHCVANMTLVPVGILYGANVTFGEFILKNLVPVTLGNIFSAVFFIAVFEWYVFGIDASVWNFDLTGRCCPSKKSDDNDSLVDPSKEDDEKEYKEGDEKEEEDEEEEEEHGTEIRGNGPHGFQKLESSATLEEKPKGKSGGKKHHHSSHHSSHKSGSKAEVELGNVV